MAYTAGVHYDHTFYRTNHRSNARPIYHERTPYQHLEHARQHLRHEYEDDIDHGTVIGHAIDDGPGGQQQRRRIAVACARCRRRKIKCSGDSGNGQGCVACRSSGADIVKDCTFNRVGSRDMSLATGYEMLPESTINMSSHSLSHPSTTAVATRCRSTGLHRASLPTLHTRSTLPVDSDVQYEASPVEAYAYTSSMAPRQDSFASTHPIENYRSWPNTTDTISTPAISQGYDHTGFAFGTTAIPSMVVPQSQHSVSRLPSVSSDSFSALNMGHLNTALPPQSIYARRLPIPPLVQEPSPMQYSAADIPEIRPLHSAHMAQQLHSMNGRNSVVWSTEGTAMSSSGLPMTTYAAVPNGLPYASLPPAASLAESVWGYQYAPMSLPAISTSPEGSPSTTLSDNSGGSSTRSVAPMPQPSMTRYSTTRTEGLPAITVEDGPISSRGSTAGLYHSFSNDSDNSGASDSYSTRPRESWPAGIDGRSSSSYHYTTSGATYPVVPTGGYYGSGFLSSDDASTGQAVGNSNQSSLPLHQPQPQHSAASIETLCRQRSPPQIQQQQHPRHDKRDHQDRHRQSSTAQARMSLSNFNSPY